MLSYHRQATPRRDPKSGYLPERLRIQDRHKNKILRLMLSIAQAAKQELLDCYYQSFNICSTNIIQ